MVRTHEGMAMAQTVCYVFRDDAQWKIELDQKQYGPYSERDAALDVAVQETRLAATHNPDGAEVRIADETDQWHTAWSIWSAKRAASAN
jgi:hypothetical protein